MAYSVRPISNVCMLGAVLGSMIAASCAAFQFDEDHCANGNGCPGDLACYPCVAPNNGCVDTSLMEDEYAPDCDIYVGGSSGTTTIDTATQDTFGAADEATATGCESLDGDNCVSSCGNEVIESGEMCDRNELGGETCASQGVGDGTLSCADDCMGFDTSGCRWCGNGQADPGEVCDGADLGAQDCSSLGFDGGDLACNDDCSGHDTTECTYECGNGEINPGEECDGDNLGEEDCSTLRPGFNFGSLSCNKNCTFDFSQCSECGNGMVEGEEVCDGDPRIACSDLDTSYFGGDMLCNRQCEYDYSNCCLGGDEPCFGTDMLCCSDNCNGSGVCTNP